MSLKWLPNGMSFVTKMFNSLNDMDAKWQYVMAKLFNKSTKVLALVEISQNVTSQFTTTCDL
jgi:hypothetical protein